MGDEEHKRFGTAPLPVGGDGFFTLEGGQRLHRRNALQKGLHLIADLVARELLQRLRRVLIGKVDPAEADDERLA